MSATVAPSELASAWPSVPSVWVWLVALAVLYRRGSRVLRSRRAGATTLPGWRAASFWAGLVALAVALASPLEPLAETLFAAHMAQHLLLAVLAAPLLVLGRPVLVTSLGLPSRLRRETVHLRPQAPWVRRHLLGVAAGAIALHVLSFWVWHVPSLYEAALRSDLLHVVEHGTILGGGLALWWLVLGARGHHANAIGVLAVFAAVLTHGALAGLITFASAPWFEAHAAGAAAWGLTALEDQQLAGGLMWFPGSVAYVAAGSTVFLRWLRDDDARGATDAVLPAVPGR